MCSREGSSLQRGMNFGCGGTYSVVLMSVRNGAPYKDRIENDGTTLIYEGHDSPKCLNEPDPKMNDQPQFFSSGRPTENGKFIESIAAYKAGLREPELVRVYEKIKQGIWSYNGFFSLVDYWIEKDINRNVFKFKLILNQNISEPHSRALRIEQNNRLIPSDVKAKVWKRDKGQCVICGATDELHFDHIIPYSKGGSSVLAENIQLLCARHNLTKSNRIE